jgi:hypothetical protein
MKSIGALAALPAAILAMVSCGGSAELSHTAFADEANRLCTRLTAKQAQFEKDYSDATSETARQKAGSDLATVTSAFIADLTALKAADPDDRAIQDLLRKGTQLAAQRTTTTDAALDAQLVDVGKKIRTSFSDGGMDECAKAAS